MSQNNVVLGFVDELQESEDFQTKIGGQPTALGNAISFDRVRCGQCSKQMVLLFQLYAPEDDIMHAYHRIIYVFVCCDGRCMTEGQSKSIKVIRCQTSSTSYDCTNKLCAICNLQGDKMCSNCKGSFYCSKEHQLAHWNAGHCDNCQVDVHVPYGYPEFFVASGEETQPDQVDDLSLVLVHSKGMEDELMEGDFELDEKVDSQFLKFQKRIRLDVHQVLRYARSGENLYPLPLLVSDFDAPEQIPVCSHCQAPRTFEFQLMPQILMHLKLNHTDPKSLDYGTILVYTCSQSCDKQIQEEYAWHQPFSEQGIQQS